MKTSYYAIIPNLFILACTWIVPATHARAESSAALTIPEIIVTSFRGDLRSGQTTQESTSDKHEAPLPGQAFAPLHFGPGTRLDINYEATSHAIITLPGAGACMITDGSSLRLPAAKEKDMTVTFDRHISSPNRMFLNIDSAQMAKHGGAVFRAHNKFASNSKSAGKVQYPQVVFSTQGGRFFIIDQQSFNETANSPSGIAVTVGAFDGSMQLEELTSGQRAELKAGSVLKITNEGFGKPRAPTKAELSYDLGCRLAASGRAAPAQLPATMKTVAKANVPGAYTNSLGMVMVPVPGTKVLMCVHETRYQDHTAFRAANPQAPDAKPAAFANGLWGWDDHPVFVSWDEANAFCSWLSQKEGKKYRLPTDEEWSYAVGIGNKERREAETTPKDLDFPGLPNFPWGTAWPPPENAGNFGDLSHCGTYLYATPDLENYDDGFAETSPVMSFKPNKLGIYDLEGNLHEWCLEWYDATRMSRFARGAAYSSSNRNLLRSSKRRPIPPDNARTAGYRIVMEQP